MNKFYISTLIFILSLGLLIGCKDKTEIAEAPPVTAGIDESQVQLTDAQFKNADIEVASPQKLNIGQVITLNGKIEVMPESSVTVSSPTSGFVRKLKLIAGMNVSQGQALMQLEDKEVIQLQQDYLSEKNTLTFAKLDYERQAELVKNQAASEKVLQMAEEKLKQTQITVKSLAEKLKFIHINPSTLTAENMTSKIVISSPTSGTITDVLVNSGTYVHAGDGMVKIIDHNGSRLVLKAFEKDLPYLKQGQKISAYSNAKMDKKMNGTIEYIVGKVGDEGFAQVICRLDGGSEKVTPGTYINADIEAHNMATWTVPNDAIVSFEGKEYLFVDKGNRNYEMTEVILGQKEDGRTEIVNFQASENQKIVTKGAYTLLMKMKNVEE